MKKLFILILACTYSSYPFMISKIEEMLTKENEKHLPAEFLEHKQYFPQSELPLWMQQRCAYIVHKAHLNKICKPAQMSSQQLIKEGYRNAFAYGNRIHLSAGHHSEISFEESMNQIGHEVSHVYDNIYRVALPTALLVGSYLCCFRKFKKTSNRLYYMSMINGGVNFYMAFFGRHFREKYADLKGMDLIEDICDAHHGALMGRRHYDNAVSHTHPSNIERIRCIDAYEEWKKKNIKSPILFLLYDALF